MSIVERNKTLQIVKKAKDNIVENAVMNSFIGVFVNMFSPILRVLGYNKYNHDTFKSDDEYELARLQRVEIEKRNTIKNFNFYKIRITQYIKFFKDTEYESRFNRINDLLNEIYIKIDAKYPDLSKLNNLNNYYLSNFDNLFNLVVEKIEDEKFEFYKEIEKKRRVEKLKERKRLEEERRERARLERIESEKREREQAEEKKKNYKKMTRELFYNKKNTLEELLDRKVYVKSVDSYYSTFKVKHNSIDSIFNLYNQNKKKVYRDYIKRTLNIDFDFEFIMQSKENDDRMIFKMIDTQKYFTIDTDTLEITYIDSSTINAPVIEPVKITDKKISFITALNNDTSIYDKYEEDSCTMSKIIMTEPLTVDWDSNLDIIKEFDMFMQINYNVHGIKHYYGNDQKGNPVFKIGDVEGRNVLDIKLDYNKQEIAVVNILNKREVEDRKKRHHLESSDGQYRKFKYSAQY